ncbi:hypothetical protein [Mesorhizobium sp.]|uniref:hypothetical protein n=1 Tax=Mesorhizobium sp. TaxID=1871066 RepID=UPI000FE91F23|nr:hypothetical protein [Mesorhizobium sp.]RWP05109.1 MAG: hypothetical protein EOQ99_16700 [Mesorhizobium sp.]
MSFPFPTFSKVNVPVVVQRQTFLNNDRATTTVLTWTAAKAGNLIVIEFVCEANGASPAAPAGYTLWPSGNVIDGGSARLGIFYKVAVGGETGVTFTHGNNTVFTIMREITGAVIAFVAPVVATSLNPDPPAITPAGGAKPYLFIAGCWASTGAAPPISVSAYSAGYLNGVTVGGTVRAVLVASAQKIAAAATENPGPLTLSSSLRNGAFVYAVRK